LFDFSHPYIFTLIIESDAVDVVVGLVRLVPLAASSYIPLSYVKYSCSRTTGLENSPSAFLVNGHDGAPVMSSVFSASEFVNICPSFFAFLLGFLWHKFIPFLTLVAIRMTFQELAVLRIVKQPLWWDIKFVTHSS
jgi:hypothetical protein